MAELLTAAQMRALEKAEINAGRVTGLELMERAGRGVVEAIFEEWPELAQSSYRAVVLCGPGNNGGDGFVVARLLKEQGWEVEVLFYGDAAKLPPDAKANFEKWTGAARFLPDHAPFDPWRFDLIVDALFGTGLTRGLSFEAGLGALLPDWDLRHTPSRPKITAVDLPSGLCSDSGRILEGEAFWADLTVSFHSEKLGHRLADGPRHCGRIVTKDIGLPASGAGKVQLRHAPNASWLDKADPFGRSTHKFSHGHALVLSGGSGRTGAARLAARGALRVGAGLVTLGVPASAQLEVASQITALMLMRAGTPDEFAAALKDTRLNALCLGPGLGHDRARALVPVALLAHRATVLDADALSAYADNPETLFNMLHSACVLTPHAGEFIRLFPDIAEKLSAPATSGPAYSKADATREAAKRAGCTVLFKGPDTVIASPDEACSVHAAVYERSAPWLATAGSGDVLAGFITGLLARGFHTQDAAELAAWLHVECALNFGPGLIAEDLPEALPEVFERLGV